MSVSFCVQYIYFCRSALYLFYYFDCTFVENCNSDIVREVSQFATVSQNNFSHVKCLDAVRENVFGLRVWATLNVMDLAK